MAGTDDRFLGRWSRLKQEHRRRKKQAADEPAVESASADSALPEAGDAKDLPDIESLDKDSDFSVFLKDGVPEELKRRALRKLWRTNPIFAVRDGLDDYDEDYRTAMVVAESLAKGLKKARKGIAEEGAGAKKQGDERSAEGRGKAPTRPRRQGDNEAAPSAAAERRGRAREAKRDDDAESG